ncbi:MAG TPA: SDR family oxidoreductase [Chloroflexota bacterium]|nr:SDR family oxidoreductase [Chloroflexota bacterium]
MTENNTLYDNWALILGASSGFGAATAKALAKKGLNIFGVHLDRSSTLPNAERLMEEIRQTGRQAVFFNTNAANPAKRAEVIDAMAAKLAEQGGQKKVRVLFHSLAFGSLGEFIVDDPKNALNQSKMEMTLDVMANSLVYWTQDVVARGLMGEDGRIYAMTSSGSHRVWPSYGAVSAAKAALESNVRQLAVELAKKKITVNAIRAGVTATPALRAIPGSDKLVEEASAKNPMGRMTRPEDVAAAVGALCVPETYWITGSVYGVDGGEDNIG